MPRHPLHIELHTWWHAGTGRGEGPRADAVVARSPAGLPILPGRTIKGLLRAAVEQAHGLGWLSDLDLSADPTLPADPLTRWFGTALVLEADDAEERASHLEAQRFTTLPGQLRFGSGRIGEDDDAALAWERWASHSAHAGDRDLLFHRLASTALDAHGVADDGTLRSIEVAVPMTLRALISGPDAPWPEALRRALPLVVALGSHRHRGLGRATLTLGDAT